jgi:hypothetical protein
MKTIASFVLLSTLVCQHSRGSESADSLSVVVQQFAPRELRETTPRFDVPPGEIRSAYASSAFGSSDPHAVRIVAVYTNTLEGFVRLLGRSGEKWVVQREWYLSEDATFPKVELRDLDSDGIPEVVVELGVGPRSEARDWLFRWTGDTLSFVPQLDAADEQAPSDERNPGSALSVADYVDIDGDGNLEVIGALTARTDDTDTDFPYRSLYQVYPYRDGKLGPRRDVAAYFTLIAPKKRDTVVTEEFLADDLTAKYNLRLIRRGGRGNWHASGAEVRMNGVVVATSKDFKERNAVVIPVSLQAKNRLEILIPDAPSGASTPPNPKDEDVRITVVVEAH